MRSKLQRDTLVKQIYIAEDHLRSLLETIVAHFNMLSASSSCTEAYQCMATIYQTLAEALSVQATLADMRKPDVLSEQDVIDYDSDFGAIVAADMSNSDALGTTVRDALVAQVDAIATKAQTGLGLLNG